MSIFRHPGQTNAKRDKAARRLKRRLLAATGRPARKWRYRAGSNVAEMLAERIATHRQAAFTTTTRTGEPERRRR